MKTWPLLAILGLFGASSYADDNAALMPPDSNQIGFQLTAKTWVNTKTALLNVRINITLNDTDLVKAKAVIMDKLAQIAPSTWHLTQFTRSQDSSGLEKLAVHAETRVDQTALTTIYQQAKQVSQPGASYTIEAIEFKPSLEDSQQARLQLREQLYQQIRDELTRINAVYKEQHYHLYQLLFIDGNPPSPEPIAYKASMVMATTPPPLTVSNELIMTAMVQAASK